MCICTVLMISVPLPDCSLNEDNFSLRCPKHKVKKERLVLILSLWIFCFLWFSGRPLLSCYTSFLSVSASNPFSLFSSFFLSHPSTSLLHSVYPEHPATQISLPGAVGERLRDTEKKRRRRSLGAVSLSPLYVFVFSACVINVQGFLTNLLFVNPEMS